MDEQVLRSVAFFLIFTAVVPAICVFVFGKTFRRAPEWLGPVIDAAIVAYFVIWLGLTVWQWRTTGEFPVRTSGMLAYGWMFLLSRLFAKNPASNSTLPRGSISSPGSRWHSVNRSLRRERDARWASLRRRQAEAEDERRDDF